MVGGRKKEKRGKKEERGEEKGEEKSGEGLERKSNMEKRIG